MRNDTVDSLALLLLLLLLLLAKERPELIPGKDKEETCVVDGLKCFEKSHPSLASEAASKLRCLLDKASSAPEAALLISPREIGRRWGHRRGAGKASFVIL